jgi:hypothetical protein
VKTKSIQYLTGLTVLAALAGVMPMSADVLGFNNGVGYTANGGATFGGNSVTLTDGNGGEARSAFFNAPQSITAGWNASFIYQATNPGGVCFCDGAAFIFQNSLAGPSAVGFGGGDYGYVGIAPSAAIEFSPDSAGLSPGGPGTGFYENATAQSSGIPLISTSPVLLNSMDPIQVALSYDGSTLFETLTDPANSNTFSTSYIGVDLPAIVGGSTAFIGFSGGTGGGTSTQTISNFSFTEATPEPGSVLLLGSGLAAILWRLRARSSVFFTPGEAREETSLPTPRPSQRTAPQCRSLR